ncbi:hypothetical protein AVEN_176560-1 [Araneus ventricosus]|uniref:Uncharacterized protein n=1 Tax=Araneus ventricosus TaxID=182803 RepID=A0A4Y2TET8_ARAVE|nr:hypothetical protein AVEN_176560-1 [Araneus ventricosus]
MEICFNLSSKKCLSSSDAETGSLFPPCEDSRTAAKMGHAKVATWTCRQNSTREFVQRASFHSISSDTWHTKPFGNSKLRRSDGRPFSVELRRDYPQTIPLIAKTVTGHKSTA